MVFDNYITASIVLCFSLVVVYGLKKQLPISVLVRKLILYTLLVFVLGLEVAILLKKPRKLDDIKIDSVIGFNFSNSIADVVFRLGDQYTNFHTGRAKAIYYNYSTNEHFKNNPVFPFRMFGFQSELTNRPNNDCIVASITTSCQNDVSQVLPDIKLGVSYEEFKFNFNKIVSFRQHPDWLLYRIYYSGNVDYHFIENQLAAITVYNSKAYQSLIGGSNDLNRIFIFEKSE